MADNQGKLEIIEDKDFVDKLTTRPDILKMFREK
jgi:hypothetical protein